MIDQVGELTPFWGAVAQIVPVLALALVIEARLIAARLTRERKKRKKLGLDKSGRRRRALLAIWLSVTWSMLALAFFYSLTFLVFDSNSETPPDNLDGLEVILALVGLVNGLAFVAFPPINRIVAALTMSGRAPERIVSRAHLKARKDLQALRGRILGSAAETADVRSYCISLAASSMISASAAERELNAHSRGAVVLSPDRVDELREVVRSADAVHNETMSLVRDIDDDTERQKILADIDRIEAESEAGHEEAIKRANRIVTRYMEAAARS